MANLLQSDFRDLSELSYGYSIRSSAHFRRQATRVPDGETSELAESMKHLESVSEQLPELRARCRSEPLAFSAAQMDLRENEWRFFSRSVGE